MSQKNKQSETFEQKLARLEALVEWFESDDATVSESSVKLEEGLDLLAQLRTELYETELKVEKIKKRYQESK